MAVNISPEYLKAQKNNPRLWYGRFRIKIAPITKKIRQFLRDTTPEPKSTPAAECHITNNLETQASHFQEHGWAFVENIFDQSFYKELIKYWPKRYWLEPPTKITKNYDRGMAWSYGEPVPESFKYHPTVKKMLDYLRTEKFQNRIKNFIGKDKDFVSYSFAMHKSYPGTQVVPHRDGIYNNDLAQNVINVFFFVNGNGGKNAGGLTLTNDAMGDDVIFEPTNLKNSCLIYDSKAPFYHGFKPMRLGRYRWSIGAQFLEKDFVEKQ